VLLVLLVIPPVPLLPELLAAPLPVVAPLLVAPPLPVAPLLVAPPLPLAPAPWVPPPELVADAPAPVPAPLLLARLPPLPVLPDGALAQAPSKNIVTSGTTRALLAASLMGPILSKLALTGARRTRSRALEPDAEVARRTRAAK
jgi:hypothetical protein